jgi:glycosyltransferase involved in cell wall biosynthesis
MKILRIIPSMNPITGGPPQGIRQITPYLQNLGIETKIVSLDSQEDQFLINEKLDIDAIGPGYSKLNYSKRLKLYLENNILKYDAVFIHCIWLFHSYTTISAFNKLQKKNNTEMPKLYLIPHGMLDPWFQKSSSRKLKALRNEIYWRLFEKKVINSVDAILFTCQKELELARTTFSGYNPKSEINIGYGIIDPLSNFKENKDATPKSPYFLFLSRIHQKKGLDLLINAYEKCLKKTNLPNLVIAGPGEESEYGLKLKNHIKTSSILNSKIQFVGMLNGNKKWNSIINCEAFILTSHQENFGISVVEALSCGIPVIISNQVNIHEEINDNGAGIICELNVDSISESLLIFSKINNEQINNMKINARECFEKNFDVKQISMKLFQLLIN